MISENKNTKFDLRTGEISINNATIENIDKINLNKSETLGTNMKITTGVLKASFPNSAK